MNSPSLSATSSRVFTRGCGGSRSPGCRERLFSSTPALCKCLAILRLQNRRLRVGGHIHIHHLPHRQRYFPIALLWIPAARLAVPVTLVAVGAALVQLCSAAIRLMLITSAHTALMKAHGCLCKATHGCLHRKACILTCMRGGRCFPACERGRPVFSAWVLSMMADNLGIKEAAPTYTVG